MTAFQLLLAACTVALLVPRSRGQTPSNPPADAAKDDPVMMSNFSVTSTQDRGYVTTNAATGFKTHQDFMKIPQAITVMTRDVIDDIGSARTSDILQYAGAANFYRGESISIRGSRVNNALLDEMPDNVAIMDNIFIDSYEVIRGPASVLYANATIGGVVLKTTKKALPYRSDTIRVSSDDNGQYRAELDLTGPMGKVGAAEFSYRLVGLVQGGNFFLRNTKDDRTALHPSIGIRYHNTSIFFGADYQEITHVPNGNNLLTPDGKLYTGAGRDEGYYAPGTMEDFKFTGGRLEIVQQLSPDWEVKVQARQYSFPASAESSSPRAA